MVDWDHTWFLETCERCTDVDRDNRNDHTHDNINRDRSVKRGDGTPGKDVSGVLKHLPSEKQHKEACGDQGSMHGPPDKTANSLKIPWDHATLWLPDVVVENAQSGLRHVMRTFSVPPLKEM